MLKDSDKFDKDYFFTLSKDEKEKYYTNFIKKTLDKMYANSRSNKEV